MELNGKQNKKGGRGGGGTLMQAKGASSIEG